MRELTLQEKSAVAGGPPLPRLNPELANLERVFRSPPMTQELTQVAFGQPSAW
jgi:hypothetical protein